MDKFLRTHPFFRLALCTAVGIFIARVYPLPLLYVIICFATLLSTYIIISIINVLGKETIQNICLIFFMCSWGILSCTLYREATHKNSIASLYPQHTFTYAKGIIISPPENKQRTTRLLVSVNALLDSVGKETRVKGKILLYVRKDSTYTLPQLNDILFFPARFQTIQSFTYTSSFNYPQFLYDKGVFFTQLIMPSELITIGKEPVSWWQYICDLLHQKIYNNIYAFMPDKESADFASALLLGRRSNLDENIRQAYRVSGIAHIMAISGLHIGTLYVFFHWLLSFLGAHRRGRILRGSLLLMIIITYGGITIGGPSILRSVCMFSVLSLSLISGRQHTALNTLFFSAFIILSFHPTALFDIGFQLSYAAVLGIMLFFPLFQKMLHHKNKLVKNIWSVMCSSLAAQLTTFPILLLFFTYFSTYFLLANLIAIPILGVLLPLLMLMVGLGAIFAPLGVVLANLAHYIIYYLNMLVIWISELPKAAIFVSYFSFWQSLCYMVCIIFLYLMLQTRKRIFANLFLYSIIFFQLSIVGYQYMSKSQYHLYLHKHYVEEVRGKKSIFYSLLSTQDTTSFELKQLMQTSYTHHHLKDTIRSTLPPITYYPQANTLIIQSHTPFLFLKPMKIHTLILGYIPPSLWDSVVHYIHFRKMVLLQTFNKKLRQQASDFCRQYHIPYFENKDYQLMELI